MKRFQVIDPKGVLHGTEIIREGSLLPQSVSGSQLVAWKRFGQVKEVEGASGEEKIDPKAPKPKPPKGDPKDGEEKSDPLI